MVRQRASRRAIGGLVAAALSCAASLSHAHGGPASVEVVAYNAAAPERMAVGTSYGLASTHDGGQSWSLTCEGAIGATGSAHPRVVVTSAGELVAGVFTGTVRSDASGCNYAAIEELDGLVALDVQGVPGDADGLVALTRQGTAYQVWRSSDDGASWSVVPTDFGPKFQAHSIGASSDPDRFYVGGISDTGGFAMLMVTDDGGQTFSPLAVPSVTTAPNDALYVEAVDPDDPERLVAALYEPPSKVLLSEDGGATWTEVFEGWTVLTGLAVSPGFDAVVTGSPAMGLWRVALPDGEPVQISEVPVRCLTWTAEALLICADDAVTGWAVGRSTDVGETVEPLLELRCLEAPDCGADSQVEQSCVAEWPTLVDAVGIEDCLAEGGAGPGVGGGGAAGVGGGGGEAGAGAEVRYTPVGGCAAMVPLSGLRCGQWLLACAAAFAFAFRRRR